MVWQSYLAVDVGLNPGYQDSCRTGLLLVSASGTGAACADALRPGNSELRDAKSRHLRTTGHNTASRAAPGAAALVVCELRRAPVSRKKGTRDKTQSKKKSPTLSGDIKDEEGDANPNTGHALNEYRTALVQSFFLQGTLGS